MDERHRIKEVPPMTHLDDSWQSRLTLYDSFTTAQLRDLYRLRRQWLAEQATGSAAAGHLLEFARYLRMSGRISG